MTSLEMYDGTAWRTLSTNVKKGGLIATTTSASTQTISALASSLSVVLPPDSTMCKFTIIGAGGAGYSPPSGTTLIGAAGGGAGASGIWLTSLYASDTVYLGNPGTPTSSAVSSKYSSTVNNYSIDITPSGNGQSNNAGGIGGTALTTGTWNTLPSITFSGTNGESALSTPSSPNIVLTGGNGGNSIFGGGGTGANTSINNTAATNGVDGTGGGGGGGTANGSTLNSGGKGGYGILIIEW